ncbi:hypothetical protein MMC13_006142 [Lambiella insularis]|nr:hypothetical protein [Lambiella insularis]
MNEDWYNAWIAFTKQSFGLLTTTLTQWWAPTVIRVSGDKSVRGQLLRTTDGGLFCNFPESKSPGMHIVPTENEDTEMRKIYTDWLYLWYIAYCNGMHGRLYIMLKESLKSIPVLGWGIQLSQFILLKRNWEKDKPHVAAHLQKLNKPTDPMWLLMFPEGTNLAPDTRERSALWAETQGITDMHHLLLPRSTGLQFVVQQLKQTVPYIYDCTIAYEGVRYVIIFTYWLRHGQYAQNIFTIQQAYLRGTPPKSVNMYWRRFAVSTIPLNDSKAFEHWIRSRWHEKDLLINEYLRTGRFPADDGVDKTSDGQIRRGAGYIETEIKAFRWYEFLQIFAPVGLFGLILYSFYDSLPTISLPSIDTDALVKNLQLFQKQLVKAAQNNLLTGVKGKTISDGVSKTLLQAHNRASKRITNRNALLKNGTSRQPLLIEAPPKVKVATNQQHQKPIVAAKKPKKLDLKKSAAKLPAASQAAKPSGVKSQTASQPKKTAPAKLAAAPAMSGPGSAKPAVQQKLPTKQNPKPLTAGSVSEGPKKLEIKPKAGGAPKKTAAKPVVKKLATN